MAAAVEMYQPGVEVEVKHGKHWLPAQVLQSTPTADGDELDAWVEVHFQGWEHDTDRFERVAEGRLRLKGGGQQWSMASSPAQQPRRAAAGAGAPTTPENQTQWQRRRSSAAAPRVSPQPEQEQRADFSPEPNFSPEQRAELLKRGRGLAKLQRMPAAVLAGGLAPPTSGAWRRRTVSKEASRYSDLDRPPLFVSPTKITAAVRLTHGSRSRPNSRSMMLGRPRTSEGGGSGGKGSRSLRKLDAMEQAHQLAPADASKARRKVKESAATSASNGAAEVPQPTRQPSSSKPADPSNVTILDGSAGRTDDVSVSVTYFAMPGRRKLRQASFGYMDPSSGQWVQPDRPPTAEELEAMRRAATPPALDPDIAKRRQQRRTLKAASRTWCA